MPVSDEIKEQRKKVKDYSLKGKLSYFWDYYRVHTLVAIVIIIFISIFIRDVRLNSREEAIHVVVLNSPAEIKDSEIEDAFADYASIDLKEFQVAFESSMVYSLNSITDTTMASNIQIMGLTQSNELDIIIADEEIFQYFAEQGYFIDLSKELPASLENSLSDDFYNSLVSYDEGESSEVFCGIEVGNTNLFNSTTNSTHKKMILGIVVNGQHKEMSLNFLKFLTN